MTGTVHLGAGIVLGIAYAQYSNADTLGSISIVAVTALGALLPDIDHENSKLGRRVWLISWSLRRLLGHRGLTHSALALVALVALVARTNSTYVIALLVGVASHILLDMLTRRGVRLLYPLPGFWRLIP